MRDFNFAHVMILAVAALIGFLIWYVIADSREMEVQNCVRTGLTRQDMYWQNIYDAKGNFVSMYPVYITEYEYKCDDYNRWR